MKMQDVLQQMTEMLSTNGSNDFRSYTKTTPNNAAGTHFHSVMSGELSKTSASTTNAQSAKKDTANTARVQTVNGKRQQELETSVNQTQKSQKEDLNSKDVLSTKDGNVVEEAQEDVITSEEMEATVQWISSVQQQICQELSITPEELESALETLGLQIFDLQNIGNVQQLVLTVSGEDSVTALLTNEELSNHVQNIMQVVTEVTQGAAQQLEIADDEFVQLLADVETAMETQNVELEQVGTELEAKTSVTEAMATETEETKTEKNATNVTKENVEPAKADVMSVQSKGKTAEMNGNSGEQQIHTKDVVTEGDEQSQEISAVSVAEEINTSQSGQVEDITTNQTEDDAINMDTRQVDVEQSNVSLKDEADGKDGKMEESSSGNDFLKKDGQQSTNTPIMEQIMNQVSNVKVQVAETIQDKVQVTQQMQEIFEQVVEQVKVTVTADTSEMAIQLNPEHLGKVNLSVVAKEGHITAQFVTENEVARQALESQIQQLRDTLGEQGLKVDKVEVSVSDFSFQEGNQANAEEQKQQQREEHAKQVHRNLNLSSLDELSDMTDAEELAVKIMQSNGNQIDYTA